jgi:transposase
MISIGEADAAKLQSIARSRTEPASRVERARILLGYRDDPSLYAVGRAVGVTHQTVQRCFVKPHKVRYYLERRDAVEADAAKACPEADSKATDKTAPNVAFVSYDEKPGIQAISNTAPDLPPVAGEHACVADVEPAGGYRLLTGQVHACVEDRHRSREFISFLKKLDAAYPSDTAIKVIPDNHSAHVSKETNKWLAAQPDGCFTFVFTPKHGSWLNLVEGFFSKMARSVLRRIRVTSKAELKQRIMAYLDGLNREPVVHTWSHRITVPAW